jgi:hypothetical protein
MKSTTYPYHVVLVPKKKTKTKRQRTWDKLPRWIKTSDSSRGYKISTRDGSVIDLDLLVTYKFLEYVRFEKPNKNDLPPSTTSVTARFTPAIFPLSELPTPQDYQPHSLVPSLAASTFIFGALSRRYRELKLKFVAGQSATIRFGRGRRPSGPTYARGTIRSLFEDQEQATQRTAHDVATRPPCRNLFWGRSFRNNSVCLCRQSIHFEFIGSGFIFLSIDSLSVFFQFRFQFHLRFSFVSFEFHLEFFPL